MEIEKRLWSKPMSSQKGCEEKHFRLKMLYTGEPRFKRTGVFLFG